MSREALWSERVEAWAASGVGSDRFAAGRGFSGAALRGWARRLRDEAGAVRRPGSVQLARVVRSTSATKGGSAALVPTTAAPAPRADDETPIVIEVGRAHVVVRRGFERATLAWVLEVVVRVAGVEA
ncbi:MAG: hypothetical protein IT374_18905 [Polyangiaceae bacterium]|nr:hypothetical protein [Polyangiaceae bacterium]